MSFNIKRKLYESLPLPIKRSACIIPFSWWGGKAYRSIYRRGAWFDRARPEELWQYQEQELGKVLRFAIDHVPAYQSLRPIVERHKPSEALKGFPLLDKDTVQADQESFLPRDIEKIPYYETTTGGTSGNQLKIYVDDCSQAVELGFMHRQWLRVGYTPGHRKATIAGRIFSRSEARSFLAAQPNLQRASVFTFSYERG